MQNREHPARRQEHLFAVLSWIGSEQDLSSLVQFRTFNRLWSGMSKAYLYPYIHADWQFLQARDHTDASRRQRFAKPTLHVKIIALISSFS
jgi:hypothetical protein